MLAGVRKPNSMKIDTLQPCYDYNLPSDNVTPLSSIQTYLAGANL